MTVLGGRGVVHSASRLNEVCEIPRSHGLKVIACTTPEWTMLEPFP